MAPAAPAAAAAASSRRVKAALSDLLEAFAAASPRLAAARSSANGDMIRHMQVVFPLAAAIQVSKAVIGCACLHHLLQLLKAEVISRHGFNPDGEGVIQFIQYVKAHEKIDPEVARLHRLVREQFIPSA